MKVSVINPFHLHHLSRRKASLGAFSLVEVAIALAIMGFACLSLIGLLPFGLSSFREAMSNTIEAEIVQNVTNDMMVADASNLNQYNNQSYYFDDEGTQLTSTGTARPVGALYTATVSMTAVDSSNSPAAFNSTTSVSAYNVTVTIVSLNEPLQAHPYPVVLSGAN